MLFRSSVNAQSFDDLAKQLADKRKEIAEVEKQLSDAQGQEKTLNSQLKFIDAQNKLTQLKIEETEFQLKKLDKEINDLSGRIDNENHLSIQFESPINQSAKIILSDMTGREVLNRTVGLKKMTNEFSFPCIVSKGIYLLTIDYTEGRISKLIY